jgi:hypothetical protein
MSLTHRCRYCGEEWQETHQCWYGLQCDAALMPVGSLPGERGSSRDLEARKVIDARKRLAKQLPAETEE